MDQQLSTQILHPLNFVNDDKARFFLFEAGFGVHNGKNTTFLKMQL